IERLQRDFGNLREVVGAGEALTDALLAPVLERFAETLDAVASARADLGPKCADLERRLRRFLERSPATGPPELFGEDLRVRRRSRPSARRQAGKPAPPRRVTKRGCVTGAVGRRCPSRAATPPGRQGPPRGTPPSCGTSGSGPRAGRAPAARGSRAG